jgi:hypothetical protein
VKTFLPGDLVRNAHLLVANTEFYHSATAAANDAFDVAMLMTNSGAVVPGLLTVPRHWCRRESISMGVLIAVCLHTPDLDGSQPRKQYQAVRSWSAGAHTSRVETLVRFWASLLDYHSQQPFMCQETYAGHMLV